MSLKEIIIKHPELEKDLRLIVEDFFEYGNQYGKNDIPAIVGESIGGNNMPDFYECWEKEKK
jgi:carboxypeptidase C (cathepsin A)